MNTSESLNKVQQSSEYHSNMQNTAEDFSNMQKSSYKRAPGLGRGKKYPGAETPSAEYEGGNFSLIMEEVYVRFENAGERRSVRMIAEYCKTGELICYYDSDDKRWHITPESVHSKIEKIKALNARKPQGVTESIAQEDSKDFTAHQRPTSSTAEARTSAEAQELERTVKELTQENMDLKITNRGKDYFIEQLKNERDAMIEKVEHGSRLIGELQTKLLQLEAPKNQRATRTTEVGASEVLDDVASPR